MSFLATWQAASDAVMPTVADPELPWDEHETSTRLAKPARRTLTHATTSGRSAHLRGQTVTSRTSSAPGSEPSRAPRLSARSAMAERRVQRAGQRCPPAPDLLAAPRRYVVRRPA